MAPSSASGARGARTILCRRGIARARGELRGDPPNEDIQEELLTDIGLEGAMANDRPDKKLIVEPRRGDSEIYFRSAGEGDRPGRTSAKKAADYKPDAEGKGKETSFADGGGILVASWSRR